jgi:hypothetical protein
METHPLYSQLTGYITVYSNVIIGCKFYACLKILINNNYTVTTFRSKVNNLYTVSINNFQCQGSHLETALASCLTILMTNETK